MLDIKTRQRKLKTYLEKLKLQEKAALEKAKEYVRSKEKNRAML